MSPKQQNITEGENPKQQLWINKESDNELEQELEQEQKNQQQIKLNHNYPQQSYQQQNQQQYPIIFNPQFQIQQIKQTNENTQVQVNPLLNNDEENQYITKQKRAFLQSVVTLWVLQIIIEMVIVINEGMKIFISTLYPFFFTALLILIYTLYDNCPINKMKAVRFIDQILFIIYFIADLFTIFVIFFYVNVDVVNYILLITRCSQCSNLICLSISLCRTNKKTNISELLLLNLIPLALMLIISTLLDQWLRMGAIVYIISAGQYILQIFQSLNLVRILNNIYCMKNKRIDINNIYTGFILFKFSYYTPF